MANLDLATLARQLLPFLKPLLQTTQGGSVVNGAPSPHGLNSTHHTGTLADSQGPQFLLLDGSRALTGNLSVNPGITLDGVDLSVHAADASAHHAPVTLASPSGLQLAGQQLQLNDALAGAGLTISGKVLAVGAGNGLTVNANDVALTTPGTLSVSSSNNAASNHTHALTSSSNPGAAASLLASNASGYLQLTRLGLGVSPSVPLHALATTEQLRLAYDGSNYAAFTVGSGGNLTLAPTGDLVFDPTGNDLLPNTGYDLNLGSLTKKYLTLHAAELWVETLVAQDTLATLGGRILVGPTTTLIADLSAADTTMDVKHNQIRSGDIVHLEVNGSLEFMEVTSTATTITGGYRYSLTRDLDGTGANNWSAGDAVFNTGQAGNGFIDLYSVRGVAASSTAGPTIVGNVRNSSTFNDWTEHWAIGNLNGLYGYGVDTYGVGLGKYGTGSENYATFEATNGVRFFTGSTVQAQLSGSVWTLGPTLTDHVRITSTGVQLKDGSTVKLDAQTDGDLFLGSNTSAAGTTYLSVFSVAQTYNGESMGAGDMLIGDNSASKANILWDKSAGRLLLRGGTSTKLYLGTDGTLVSGSNDVRLNDDGLTIGNCDVDATTQKVKWINSALTVEHGTMQVFYDGTSGVDTMIFDLPYASANNNAFEFNLANLGSGAKQMTFNQVGLNIDGQFNGDSVNVTGFGIFGSYVKATTLLYVNETSNADMTTGLTLNQGAADDQIAAFKSSDIAHGMTNVAETDTYGYVDKYGGAVGGLRIVGLTESTVGFLTSALYTTGDTARSTAALSAFVVNASKKSGTGLTNPSTNENLFTVRSNGNTRFLVDAEGDIHMDATSNINAWDAHNDIQLLAGVREAMNPGLRLAEFVEDARPVLKRTGVVTYNPDGHHFISLKKLHALEIDAMRQLYQRIENLEKELETLR